MVSSNYILTNLMAGLPLPLLGDCIVCLDFLAFMPATPVAQIHSKWTFFLSQQTAAHQRQFSENNYRFRYGEKKHKCIITSPENLFFFELLRNCLNCDYNCDGHAFISYINVFVGVRNIKTLSH